MLSGRGGSGADVPMVESSATAATAARTTAGLAEHGAAEGAAHHALPAAPEVSRDDSTGSHTIEMLLDSLPPGSSLHELERSLHPGLPQVDQHGARAFGAAADTWSSCS